MLLSSRGKPYICWRCIGRHARTLAVPFITQNRRLNQTLAGASSPAIHLGTLDNNSTSWNDRDSRVPRSASNTEQHRNTSKKSKLSIRDELRAWALDGQVPEVTSRPLDVSLSARVNNRLTRTQGDSSSLDGGFTDDVGDMFGFAQEEGVGISGTHDRQVGDLVELATSASRWGTLAVYLGFFSGRHHFYSHNSKWLMSAGFPAVFSVAQFATPEELQSVLGSIPMGLSVEEYQQMQKQNQGPSRNDGAELLRKMRDFRLESELIHQNNIVTLDSARELLAHDTEVRHLSLFEITDILLPKARNDDGSFPASALYSVLTVLGREDIAFRALSPSKDCHRKDYMFEIIPKATVQSIKRAIAAVRQYTLHVTNKEGVMQAKHAKSNALQAFVAKARAVVMQSRTKRGWTPHGTLEPTEGFELREPEWKHSNIDIIQFLQWWASYDVFTTSSHYHSYGSTILRATGLYEDAPLDQRTAWTFLQELGQIDSREIPSRFRIRLPGTTFGKAGGITRKALPEEAIAESQQADIASERRVQVTGNVLCIDSPDTVIVDDGLSLERTDKPDEFWIHVHVADPASRIKAKSELAGFLELIPENIYLPGHFAAMLPPELGKDAKSTESPSLLQELSLHPGSLALTFSARVDTAGNILEYDIKPSKLTQVSYLDPADVSKFCEEPLGLQIPNTKLSVGKPYPPETYGEPRSMVTPELLDNAAQDDLRILHKLGQALRTRRLAEGAWPVFPPRPSVSVRFEPNLRNLTHDATEPSNETSTYDATPDPAPSHATIKIPADPYIEVQYQRSEGCSVVANAMVLAGQVAARWCSDRGIPLPFRRDTASHVNRDQALAYVRAQVYPLLMKGVDPGREHRSLLSALIGGTELATAPGPYFILGLDSYVKVTSPLRRFGDLLAHWQIHAALAHEALTGAKVVPSNVDDIVPYPKEDLASTLTLLQMREKMIRSIAQGSRDWILIALVRAWRANDSSVPATMRFTVTTRGTSGLLGELDYFNLPASMDAVQIDNKVLIQDVSVGDQLEVELADINVYDGIITVKALEYLGRTKDSPPMPSLDTRPLIPAGARDKGFGVFQPSHKTAPSAPA